MKKRKKESHPLGHHGGGRTTPKGLREKNEKIKIKLGVWPIGV
jgi:hypothetical protein